MSVDGGSAKEKEETAAHDGKKTIIRQIRIRQ
jgi:type IV secretory pathway VirB9-like protein